MSEAKDALASATGNVYTNVLSLRREDAARLGFDNAQSWRSVIEAQIPAMAQSFKISLSTLRWYAAFHNESYHPHCHLILWSEPDEKPYLTERGIKNIKSGFVRHIFRDELFELYQTKDTLHKEIKEAVSVSATTCRNIAEKLLELKEELIGVSGRKVYKYLPENVKEKVDSVMASLAEQPAIKQNYAEYLLQKELQTSYYKAVPQGAEPLPFFKNPDFRDVQNLVISAALKAPLPRTVLDQSFMSADDDRLTGGGLSEEIDRERNSAMWRYYCEAKELLDRESEDYDPDTAVALLTESANLGCDIAKYRLGKMFLRGEDVAKNIDYALRWLEEAIADGNSYAEYLLGKTLLRGEDIEQDLPRGEDLLKRSSDKGNRCAKYTLGKAYLEGQLLLQNIPEAIRLLTESANANFAPSQYLLGRLMSQGEVMPKDLEKAIGYLELAAGQGNPYAAYLAGKLLTTEEGIKDNIRAQKHFEIATTLLNEVLASEPDNIRALNMLGIIYLYGNAGIEADPELGKEYLNRALALGDSSAQELLETYEAHLHEAALNASMRLVVQVSRLAASLTRQLVAPGASHGNKIDDAALKIKKGEKITNDNVINHS